MDETRLRAVMREEIALAMKTLEDQAYSSDPEDDISLERALSYFNSYAYEGACEKADEERAANEANPFEEEKPDATTEALREVLASLRDRGADADHIARVEKLVRDREGR